MWQSADRNHRYGQTNSVVYHTISCSTIDDKIAEALQYKANMVESVFKALRILPERIIKDGKEISKRSTGNRREIARSVG
jgi:SNF2 family DNA or RNA helicase